jgi:hypothetical protein
MNINQRALELAAMMRAAVMGAQPGKWFIAHDHGAIAAHDDSADGDDVKFYGGAMVCESVNPRNALPIVACQPQNVAAVCDELLRIKKELQHQQLINKDHGEAFSRLRDAAADACDRLKRIDDLPF